MFIKERHETTVDTVEMPFFYNHGGMPAYLDELSAEIAPLMAATTNPAGGNRV